jgi:hypothetical protein
VVGVKSINTYKNCTNKRMYRFCSHNLAYVDLLFRTPSP